MKSSKFFFMIYCLSGFQLYSMEIKFIVSNETENSQQIFNTISGDKNYFCMTCEKHFDQSSSRSHQHTINNNNEFNSCICEMCQEPLYTASGLHWHLANVHSVGPYKCWSCGKVFPYYKVFQKHKHKKATTEKTLICNDCNTQFENGRYLAIHRANEHKVGYKCDNCNQVFAFLNIWKNHGCKGKIVQ